MRVSFVIRVRDNKRSTRRRRQKTSDRADTVRGPHPEAGTKHPATRRLCGRSPQKIVPSTFRSSVRRRSRSTTTRLRASPVAARGRQDFMFTNFSKPGNDAPEIRRPMSSIGTESARRVASRRHIASPLAAPWRDAPHRAFASLLSTAREIGKGRERRESGGIHASIARSKARAFPPPDSAPRGGNTDAEERIVVVVRHDLVASRRFTPKLLARQQSFVAHATFSRLRVVANKFAWRKSGARVYRNTFS